MSKVIAIGTSDQRVSRALAANCGHLQKTRQTMQPRMQDRPGETETCLNDDDQRRDRRFGGSISRQAVH